MMKRILSLLLVAAMTLSLLLTFTACENKETPADRFEEIISNTFGDDTTVDYLNGKDSACVEIVYKPTDDTASLLEGVGNVTIRSYADKNNAFAWLMDAEIMEKTLDLALYGDDEALIVTSDLLGETAYGVTPTSLLYLLMNFVAVAPNDEPTLEQLPITEADANPTAFTSIEEDESAMPAWISLFTSVLADPDFKALADHYRAIIRDAINTDIEASVKTDDNGSSFSFSFNNDSAKKILKEIFNEAKDDKALRDYVSELIAAISPDEVEDAMAEYDEFFADSNSLDDVFDAIDEIPFRLTVKAGADNDDVLNYGEIILETEAEGDGLRLTLYGDAKTKGKSEIGIRVETREAESTMYVTDLEAALTLEVTEDSETRYAASLQATFKTPEADTTLKLLTLDYNKASGDYTMSFPILGRLLFGTDVDIAMKGNGKETEAGSVMTVTQITCPDMTTGTSTDYQTDITITVTYGVEMPKAPEAYKDVTTLTEEDLAALQETFMAHPLVRLVFEESKPVMRPQTPLPDAGAEKDDDPEERVLYTGEYLFDDATLALGEKTAVLTLTNEETTAGLTISQVLSITGIVTEHNGETLIVSFGKDGASASMSMALSGTGAEAVKEMLKSQLTQSEFSAEAMQQMVDMINGKEITVSFGSELWDEMVDFEGEATFRLNDEAKTFIEVE